jgi:hypothetical protein
MSIYKNFKEIENKINAAMKEKPKMVGHVLGGAGHPSSLAANCTPASSHTPSPTSSLIPNPTPTSSFTLALSPSSAPTSDPIDIPSSQLGPYTPATAQTHENGNLEDGLPSSLLAFPTLSTLPPLPFTQVADAPSSRPPVKKGVCWKYLQKKCEHGKKGDGCRFSHPRLCHKFCTY